jgi:class 3 adenylate cyclase
MGPLGPLGPARQAIPPSHALVSSRRGGDFLSTESATILFTDVVGSAELSQRLSVEAADEVRRVHVSILRQAIAEAAPTR